jgi:hypothetical protein
MKDRIYKTILVIGGILSLISLYRMYDYKGKLEAYEIINQQRGTIIRDEQDKALYVTFRLRQNSGMAFETPEFKNALNCIDDIGEVKGVSMDSIILSPDTLDALNNLDTLEKINLNNTGLSDEQISQWFFRWKSTNPKKSFPILQ